MERIARSLPRLLQVALILVLATGMMTTSGCKWFGKKKDVLPPPTDMTPTAGNPAPVPQDYKIGELSPLPEMKIIYFDYDRSDIRPNQIAAADADVKYLQANPDIKVYITGHCDERGSVEYNFNLGMRRAGAVRDYFVSHGIPASRIEPASKGKEQPAVMGKGEAVYSKNRRAEFQRMH